LHTMLSANTCISRHNLIPLRDLRASVVNSNE
jgi:hypothetical protein